MFGFSKKKFQVNLSRPRRKPTLTPPPRKRLAILSYKKFLIFLLTAVLVLIFVATFPRDNTISLPSRERVQAPPSTTPEDVPNAIEQIVTEVNKQYLLPVDETPTMALITSLDDLAGQDFFKKAEVGDIVLLYLNTKKGVLWRPTTRQVIEVGPIQLKNASTTEGVRE